MKIENIKDKLEKATIAVATVKDNKPHAIAIMYAKVKEGKVIITNNYMKTTVDNLKENSNIALVFWEGESGWRVEGKAEYYEKGKWLDFVKQMPENEGEAAKGAIVINVENIKELG